MALADRTPPTQMSGLPCSVGALLDRLDGDELAAFQQMLGTPEQRGWSATAIYDAVRDEGYDIGRQSINRHRGRTCRCHKDAS